MKAQINKVEAWITIKNGLQEPRAQCTIFVDSPSSMFGSTKRVEVNIFDECVTKEFALSVISEKIAIEQRKLDELKNCKP